jgi:hypothetical protein
MSVKTLVRKFGFNQLVELCNEKNWSIPDADYVLANRKLFTDYGFVWVSDKCSDELSAWLLDTHTGKLVMCNKNFMQHAIVIVASCATCEHLGNKHNTLDLFMCSLHKLFVPKCWICKVYKCQ